MYLPVLDPANSVFSSVLLSVLVSEISVLPSLLDSETSKVVLESVLLSVDTVRQRKINHHHLALLLIKSVFVYTRNILSM